jgi:3-hydroxybutyryl-CoA dehydrogenase
MSQKPDLLVSEPPTRLRAASWSPADYEVAIVGAGTMGHAFALTFLGSGVRVALNDIRSAALDGVGARVIDGLRSWLGEDAVADAQSRLRVEEELANAVGNADVIIEAIVEDSKAKQDLFAELDRVTRKDAVLCTNTSALPVAQVTASVTRAERALGTHWFNPPHLIPAVEVIRTPRTSDEAVAFVVDLLETIGKVPVVVPDVPGFIANRLQMALAKEAILCVAEGLASAEQLDRLFINSIGFRLAAAGPLAIADFAGLDVYLSVFRTLAADSERFEPPDALRVLAEGGHVGVKSGAGFVSHDDPQAELGLRDRRLLALSRLRATAEWGEDDPG